MSSVLIIGAGGVGNVTTKKCAQHPDVFQEIYLASRTKKKCDKIAKEVRKLYGVEVKTAQVDADIAGEVIELINSCKPDLVIHLALPYQDIAIMEACLETGVNYLDTANYEAPDKLEFSYKEQWAYHKRFKEKGIMALLGCGFDPGVTNVFCAYARKHFFDSIRHIDILDCNAGKHGHPFATNFNPEINIREVTLKPKYWENGKWMVTSPILDDKCIHFAFDYPEAGPMESYLLYHEEMESLVKHIKGLERIRFWMTFSDAYITHLKVLQNIGMTRIDEVEYKGQKIVPLKFLKALLPEPASLGVNYEGKTIIGCIFKGLKDGKTAKKYIYNICDHEEAYKEVQAQAVSYTTGVPAMIGAMMMLKGSWKGEGVFNVEELDPDPFMDELKRCGLPWQVTDFKGELPDFP